MPPAQHMPSRLLSLATLLRMPFAYASSAFSSSTAVFVAATFQIMMPNTAFATTSAICAGGTWKTHKNRGHPHAKLKRPRTGELTTCTLSNLNASSGLRLCLLQCYGLRVARLRRSPLPNPAGAHRVADLLLSRRRRARQARLDQVHARVRQPRTLQESADHFQTSERMFTTIRPRKHACATASKSN